LGKGWFSQSSHGQHDECPNCCEGFHNSFSLIYKSKVDGLTPAGKKSAWAQNARLEEMRGPYLDKEDLDSGEQILWNPWNGIVAIRVSRTERQQCPNILTRC
jgi:hypothetical protein